MLCIDDLVPKDHLLRAVDAALDSSFIYDAVQNLYADEIGRPSLDPIILIKLPMLQYMFGIRSMRQTIREIEVNMACIVYPPICFVQVCVSDWAVLFEIYKPPPAVCADVALIFGWQGEVWDEVIAVAAVGEVSHTNTPSHFSNLTLSNSPL